MLEKRNELNSIIVDNNKNRVLSENPSSLIIIGGLLGTSYEFEFL